MSRRVRDGRDLGKRIVYGRKTAEKEAWGGMVRWSLKISRELMEEGKKHGVQRVKKAGGTNAS